MPVKPTKSNNNGRKPSVSADDIVDFMNLRDELVAQMQRDGTSQPGFAPLLSEFSEALRVAAKLRATAEEEPFAKSERSGRSYIHPGFAAADIEVRRAALLLQRVSALAKPPPPEEGEPEEDDPFAELEADTKLDPDPAEDARIRREMAANVRAASKK